MPTVEDAKILLLTVKNVKMDLFQLVTLVSAHQDIIQLWINSNVCHVVLDAPHVQPQTNVTTVNLDTLHLIKVVCLIAQLAHSMQEISARNAPITVLTVLAQ